MSTSTAATTVETQHSDAIHDTQFDYYGRFMATASSDKQIKVFATGEEGGHAHVATLQGHDGPVWMLDWAHPSFGVALASCSYDQKAIVWKAQADERQPWKTSTVITAHTASVNAVRFAPQSFGLALATAGSDGNVFVTACPDGAWRDPVSVATEEASGTAHAMGAMGVSFAPMQTAESPVLLASGGADAAVKVWISADASRSKWALLRAFRDHNDWVRDVAFSPDVAQRHVVLASCSQDKTVLLRRAARDNLDTWETSAPVTFADTVWRLNWSPCGSMLLVTTADAQAFVLKQGAAFTDEWVRTPVSTEDPEAPAKSASPTAASP